MQTLLKYILGLAILFLVSCKKEQTTPKVTYEDSKSKLETSAKIDSSSIKIADLPVLMEGTKYLIHPIGDVRVYDDYKSVYGSSKTNQVSYAISNYNRFELTGYFTNLKFQNIDSTEVRTLTTNRIQIQSVTFLNTFAEKTKKQILVYSFVDNDTNKDGNIIKEEFLAHQVKQRQ